MKHFKPLEFAQKLVLLTVYLSAGIVLLMAIGNFILLWAGKQGMEQETVTAFTVFGGIVSSVAIAAYGVLTGWRNHSENKHVKNRIKDGSENNGNQLETEIRQP